MRETIKRLEWLIEQLGGLARFCVLALVLLVATNVILRYLFSIGPVSLQELEWHLISPIALIGLSYSMKHRADVRIDFVYERFSEKHQGYVDILSSLLTIAIGFIIVWLSIGYVEQSYQLNEGSPDPGGLTMRYLLKAFIPFGFALLIIQGVADVLRGILRSQSDNIDSEVSSSATAGEAK